MENNQILLDQEQMKTKIQSTQNQKNKNKLIISVAISLLLIGITALTIIIYAWQQSVNQKVADNFKQNTPPKKQVLITTQQPTPSPLPLETLIPSPTIGEITDWKTYTGKSFSYQYPSNLVKLSNPRNITLADDIQYYLLNEKISQDYLNCLKTANKQIQQYKQNPRSSIKWVDWEGACDINRVILKIFVDQNPDSNIKDKPEATFVDNKKRKWTIFPFAGMGDEVGIVAKIDINNTEYLVTIISSERALKKYLAIKKPLSKGKGSPEYEQYLKYIAYQILSTFMAQTTPTPTTATTTITPTFSLPANDENVSADNKADYNHNY